jgi:hypothetical protein
MKAKLARTGSGTARSSRSVGLWVAAFTLLAGSAVVPAREPAESPASTVSNWFSRNEQPLKQYRALRRMHAATNKGGHEAWLEAWTELNDGKFSYEIVSERGSDMVRGKVLRAMLKKEQELVNSGQQSKGDLTPANYEFAEATRTEDGSQVVEIKPKRDDVLLVEGRAVLNEGGELVRVEGKLSKNPSFWTSLVNIVRRYARIGGVRVPVATETTAKIKFVGTSHLQVVYDYESVNGRPVSLSERRPAGPVHIAER